MGELLDALNELDHRGEPSTPFRAGFPISQPGGQRGHRDHPRARDALGHTQPVDAPGTAAKHWPQHSSSVCS